MKKKLSFTIKTLLLIIIIGIVISKMSLIVSVFGKSNEQDPDRMTTLFYYLPENSIDILFLGDSHSYCTYVNQMIYDETGITSASLASSASSVINSYWELKEALRKQHKIQMVVMDTHPFEVSGYPVTENFMLHFTSGISMLPDVSFNKILNYRDIKSNPYGSSNKVNFFNVYSLFEFKEDYDRNFDNWKQELLYIFMNPAKLYSTFGYYPTSKITDLGEIATYKNNQTHKDFTVTLEYDYLKKIYTLCQQNNIEFVLSRAVYNDDFDAHYYNEQLNDWALRNNVKLIDYFDNYDECGFDSKTDFRDIDHFNYWGAKKATRYFIDNFLKDYTSLIDNNNKELWESNDYDYTIFDIEIKEKVGELNENME